jgi:hypothetical protein
MQAGDVAGALGASGGVRLGLGSPVGRKRAVGQALPLLLGEVRAIARG